jgi:hypothetical protein
MNNWIKYKKTIGRPFVRIVSYDAFPFARLILLFGVSILFFTLYSFKENAFKIFNTELKQTQTKEVFYPSVLPEGLMANVSRQAEDTTTAMDSTKQKFLLIGDSMLEGLGYRLNDYCRQNGHTMNSVIWYSSSSLWYGNCDTLAYFIKKFEPTYIILVLGANELFIKDIYKRDAFVKHILKQIGSRKYIWVGPPNWKDDTGINNLIVKNTGYKRYYPSKNLTYKRSKDGAHPTRESAVVWMDSVASFIMNKSKYPVLMKFPSDSIKKKSPPTTLLMPNAPPNL